MPDEETTGPPRVRRDLLAAAGALLGAAGAGLVAWDVLHGGPLSRWEAQHWNEVAALIPPGFVHALQVLGLLGTAPALALLWLLLLATLVRRRDWSAFYPLVVAGAGAAAAVVVGQWWLHRRPPLPAEGPLAVLATDSFPHEAAFLGLLLLHAAWLLRRSERRDAAVEVSFGVLAVAVWLAPVVTGAAWPTDALAGLAVVGFWTGALWAAPRLWQPDRRRAVLLAVQVVLPFMDPHARYARFDRHDEHARPWSQRLASLARTALRHPALPWSLVGLGVILRVTTFWTYDLGIDANRYAVMAQSLRETGTLTMPWGPVYEPGTGPALSRHYPPLYPAYLAGFYAVLGFSATTTHVAAIVSSLLALAAVYGCSRDLYGPCAARAATAAVALAPLLVQSTGKGYSENLVLALFVLTLWCILKSLKQPWFIVPGGVFAGLGYLAKSSMGAFFVLAGIAGLAWRLWWRGWRVLRDPAYLTAAALFGTAVVAWSLRNVRAYGSWQTSLHLANAYETAAAAPHVWAVHAVLTFVFLSVMGYLVLTGLLSWLPRLVRIPRLGDEHDSGLWLALLLPLALTSVITAALWMHEDRFYFTNVRYIAFIIVPAAWLLVRHVEPDARGTGAAVAVSILVLATGSVVYALPSHPIAPQVSDSLRGHVEEGDVVAFAGIRDVYRYYFDLTLDGTQDVTVRVVGHGELADAGADWIVMRGDPELVPPGYERHSEADFQVGPAKDAMTVWRRA